MYENDDELSSLLDGLSSFEAPKQEQRSSRAVSKLEDKDINQYVLDKSKALIEAGVEAVQDLKDIVVQAQDPDEIGALAKLLDATTKAIDTLNKTNLIDRKADRDEKLKKIEIEAKKELIQLKPGNTVTNNTNVLIASREEIMKKLIEVKESKLIEIDNK